MPRPKSKVNDELPFCFTSMIDVVFLLLIFFILQPLKQEEKRLPNELPKDVGPGQPEQRQNVRILIRKHPNDKTQALFTVNQTPLGSDGNRLHREILSQAKNDTKVTVAVVPDPKVHFQHVLKVLDQCAVAGMTSVMFEAPAGMTFKK